MAGKPNKYRDAYNVIDVRKRLSGVDGDFKEDLDRLIEASFRPATEEESTIAKRLRETLEKAKAGLNKTQQEDVRTITNYIDNWYNEDKSLGVS